LEIHDVLTGLGIMVGLAGIVAVILPGLLIVTGSALIWAFVEGGVAGWVVAGVTVVVTLATMFLKYQRPAQRLTTEGVPASHLILASVAGVVGLFVVPIVGGPLFFVAVIYLLAMVKHGRDRAWPATRAALRAVIASVGIELAGGALIAVVFLAGAVLS
jgi:uncharacterized protein YqgC (DUF456 family)